MYVCMYACMYVNIGGACDRHCVCMHVTMVTVMVLSVAGYELSHALARTHTQTYTFIHIYIIHTRAYIHT
jgi:hypothetical protein